MFICVLDFEATCWEGSVNREQMEIIEFPSVLYKIHNKGTGKESVALIDEFHEYCRPVMNPTLTDFCTGLTGIKQETVDAADTLPNVLQRHTEWLLKHTGDGKDVFILTCGAWDLRTMLPLELKNKSLPSHHMYGRYLNIKELFESVYNRKAGGMTDLLSKLRIPLTGRHHSGIDDTRNIAKIFLQMTHDGLTTPILKKHVRKVKIVE
jgi:inhibitor of KinA sporulation pathway (predicted exonuclease)